MKTLIPKTTTRSRKLKVEMTTVYVTKYWESRGILKLKDALFRGEYVLKDRYAFKLDHDVFFELEEARTQVKNLASSKLMYLEKKKKIQDYLDNNLWNDIPTKL